MHEDEIWKDINIKGFEGLYRISNYGKVLNIKRNKIVKSHNRNCMISLHNNNNRFNTTEARLVLQHFDPIKDEDENEYYVARKNKDKKSIYYNHISNLYWKKYIKSPSLPFEYDGKYYTNIFDFCEKNNIRLCESTIRWRVTKGWSIEEILKIPKLNTRETCKKTKLFWYKYYEKIYNINELTEMSGLRKHTILERIRNGWSVEQAVDTPLLHKGGGKKCKEN